MAEQNTPETDKIKELLAQLRATFDVEEETPTAPPLFPLSEEEDEEPVEEITDEPVEEIIDEPVEEIIDEPVEEIIDEPVEEIIEAPVEEIIDEPVEKITDEPVEEISTVSEKKRKPEEPRGYYQLSIMGDLCDEEKHIPSYYEDEDLTETFIVRATVGRTINVSVKSSSS